MTTKNTTANPVDAAVESFCSSFASRKADANGYYDTKGRIDETRGGNLVAKSQEHRAVSFINNVRKSFVKNGSDVTSTAIAMAISKAAKLKDVFAAGLTEAQINQRASNVGKALRASYPETFAPTAEFNHAQLLKSLKAQAKFVVVVKQAAPIKVVKKVDVPAPKQTMKTKKQPAAQLEIAVQA